MQGKNEAPYTKKILKGLNNNNPVCNAGKNEAPYIKKNPERIEL